MNGIDTRLAFRLYAVLALAAGAAVFGTGIRGIPNGSLPAVPSGRASLIWIAGTILIAAGCWAIAFTRVDEPAARRRGLFLFAFAHLLVGVFLFMQWQLVWFPHLSVSLPAVPIAAGAALLALAALAPRDAGADLRRLRTRFEAQIREAARLEERSRLARDLHDAVKQQLFAIQTAAATAEARFDTDPRGARDAIAHVRSAATDATTEMEALLDELQATPLENVGLVEALKKQCEALGLRTGADVDLQIGTLPPSTSLPPGAQEAIYRAAQEALANIGRHARAHRVSVRLDTIGQRLELRVADNGAGFDTAAARTGMGHRNLHERAAELGGRAHVVSTPGRGTEVRLEVPVNADAAGKHWRAASIWAVSLLFFLVFWSVRGADPFAPLFLLALTAGLSASLMAGWHAARRRSLG